MPDERLLVIMFCFFCSFLLLFFAFDVYETNRSFCCISKWEKNASFTPPEMVPRLVLNLKAKEGPTPEGRPFSVVIGLCTLCVWTNIARNGMNEGPNPKDSDCCCPSNYNAMSDCLLRYTYVCIYECVHVLTVYSRLWREDRAYV